MKFAFIALLASTTTAVKVSTDWYACPMTMEGTNKVFDSWDTNKNGEITKEEVIALNDKYYDVTD